jgi:hypothetical protein
MISLPTYVLVVAIVIFLTIACWALVKEDKD